MKITSDQVVYFHYTLKNEQGESIETSTHGEPMAYLHGHDNLIPGLENALESKAIGERFTVQLAPEEAYGPRHETAVQRVPLKHLHGAEKWRPGMWAEVQTEHGVRQVRILKVGKFMADVDMNHPLAGQSLTFEIEVTDIRAATPEELAHGHVHGAGGHHH